MDTSENPAHETATTAPPEAPAAPATPGTSAGSSGEDGKGAVAALRRLVELALAHPDIGPPLADLAYATGHKDIGDQLVRLGTERDNPKVEYFVIAGYAARRGRRHADVFAATLSALKALRDQGGDAEEAERVLQLVRTALSVLMFDLKDVSKEPEFVRELAGLLPALEDRIGGQVQYRLLLAQALWFTDKDASEREWERAREIAAAVEGPAGLEAVWNARGTWAKEADRDLDKAERAYRRGLESSSESALLLHNLAQVLVERAEHAAPSPGMARHLLSQAQDLLRRTLRADVPRLRRHIHATRDRLEAVRRALPRQEPPPLAATMTTTATASTTATAHATTYPQAQGSPSGGGYPQRQAPRHPAPAPRAEQQAGAQGQAYPAAGNDRPQAPRRDRPPQRRDDNRRGSYQNPPRAPEPPKDPGQAFLRTGTVTLGDLLKAKLEQAAGGGKKDGKDAKDAAAKDKGKE